MNTIDSKVQKAFGVWHTINGAFKRKNYCTSVFLDVSQAFNKVLHKGLLFKIKRYLPITYLNLISYSLSDREFRLSINGTVSKPINSQTTYHCYFRKWYYAKRTWTSLHVWKLINGAKSAYRRSNQSKLIRVLTNAPWYVRNQGLHTDLNLLHFKDVIKKKRNQLNKLEYHPNATQKTQNH